MNENHTEEKMPWWLILISLFSGTMIVVGIISTLEWIGLSLWPWAMAGGCLFK